MMIQYSVIVPTFNGAQTIGQALNSLLAQDTQDTFEVLIVDNNSSDGTKQVVSDYQLRAPGKFRYVFEERQGLSTARNAGITAARGDIIAFLDDDEVADPGWLRALAETYRKHPDASCVGGRIILKLPDVLPAWFDPTSQPLTMYLSQLDFGETIKRIAFPDAVIGGNFSVTRASFNRVGLFNTNLGRFGSRLLSGEDLEFCRRLHRSGGTVYYCGAARVTHLISVSRITKRYLRDRAFWDGKSRASLSITPSWRFTFRSCLKSPLYYSIGNQQRGFAHELDAWRLAGYLKQKLTRLN